MLKPVSSPLPYETGAIDALRFREAMSRVAGSVHIVTTDGPAGRAGFTATAVAPVTDDPASLLVCVNAGGRSAQMLTRNGGFCVNTLAAGDVALAEAFAGRAGRHGAARFELGRWGRLATGAPVLETGIAAFDCRLTNSRLVATHYVMIGEVVEVKVGPAGPGLVYRERGYHEL